tara:strand:+ start:660 stop:1667 length:1008 start_codon:yes stop_codon:yes gene_type:complete
MGQSKKMRKQKGGAAQTLDELHKRPDVTKFVESVREITLNEAEQIRGLEEINNKINNIILVKDNSNKIKSTLNTYKNKLGTRPKSDMTGTIDTIVNNYVTNCLNETGKLTGLRTELDTLQLGLTEDELRHLSLQPYIQHGQTGGDGLLKGANNDGSMIPGVLAGALCGGAIFIVSGPLGLAIFGGFMAFGTGVTVGVLKAMEDPNDPSYSGGGEVTNDFDRGFILGKEIVTEKHPDHIAEVFALAAKNELIVNVSNNLNEPINPNQNTYDTLMNQIKQQSPAPEQQVPEQQSPAPEQQGPAAGGKRRKRKANKSKKRSAKKSKRNTKRKTKKSHH